MRPLPLLTALVLFACALSAQNIAFIAGGAAGMSGSLCDPWSCTPAPVNAIAGTPLQLRLNGNAADPQFLLLSLPPAQCATLPGFADAPVWFGAAIPTWTFSNAVIVTML